MLNSASHAKFLPGHVERVSHLRDLFALDTPDLVWIGELAVQKGWTIISGDAFRKANGAERRVLQASGLSVFVLQPSWSNYPYWEKTPQLIRWWPRMVEQANSVEGIAMEVPWKLSAKFRQL
jgi:hypothetical protein